MARFYGIVGFSAESIEVSPGVWVPKFVERNYYGNVLDDNRDWQKGESINNDLIITNRISILADPYAYKNIGAMRYIELYGQRWSIRSTKISRPRLILTIGGVYTDEQA